VKGEEEITGKEEEVEVEVDGKCNKKRI